MPLIPAAHLPPIMTPIAQPALATGEISISSNAPSAKMCTIPRAPPLPRDIASLVLDYLLSGPTTVYSAGFLLSRLSHANRYHAGKNPPAI